MCICEFCHTEYTPRPQVKKPRACPGCQKQRQRDNEYCWRKLNPRYASAQYHELQRGIRDRKLKAAADALSECIRIGKEMVGINLEMKELGVALMEFLHTLGIRRVNKLWKSEMAM